MASLAAMEQMNFQQWIDDQMGLPLQSHREFWRQRANPHLSAMLGREFGLFLTLRPCAILANPSVPSCFPRCEDGRAGRPGGAHALPM